MCYRREGNRCAHTDEFEVQVLRTESVSIPAECGQLDLVGNCDSSYIFIHHGQTYGSNTAHCVRIHSLRCTLATQGTIVIAELTI
jgi:hypothetical protein